MVYENQDILDHSVKSNPQCGNLFTETRLESSFLGSQQCPSTGIPQPHSRQPSNIPFSKSWTACAHLICHGSLYYSLGTLQIAPRTEKNPEIRVRWVPLHKTYTHLSKVCPKILCAPDPYPSKTRAGAIKCLNQDPIRVQDTCFEILGNLVPFLLNELTATSDLRSYNAKQASPLQEAIDAIFKLDLPTEPFDVRYDDCIWSLESLTPDFADEDPHLQLRCGGLCCQEGLVDIDASDYTTTPRDAAGIKMAHSHSLVRIRALNKAEIPLFHLTGTDHQDFSQFLALVKKNRDKAKPPAPKPIKATKTNNIYRRFIKKLVLGEFKNRITRFLGSPFDFYAIPTQFRTATQNCVPFNINNAKTFFEKQRSSFKSYVINSEFFLLNPKIDVHNLQKTVFFHEVPPNCRKALWKHLLIQIILNGQGEHFSISQSDFKTRKVMYDALYPITTAERSAVSESTLTDFPKNNNQSNVNQADGERFHKGFNDPDCKLQNIGADTDDDLDAGKDDDDDDDDDDQGLQDIDLGSCEEILVRESEEAIRKDVLRTDKNIAFYAGEANPNGEKLVSILKKYVCSDPNPGYIQGMSDLLSLILLEVSDESEAYWCFKGMMRHMRPLYTFPDESENVRTHIHLLSILLKCFDPELFRFFEEKQTDLKTFCLRWFLVLYKRELPHNAVLNVWETAWAAYPNRFFHVFLGIAILVRYRNSFFTECQTGSDVAEYTNKLSFNMDDDELLKNAKIYSLYASLSPNFLPPDLQRALNSDNTSKSLSVLLPAEIKS